MTATRSATARAKGRFRVANPDASARAVGLLGVANGAVAITTFLASGTPKGATVVTLALLSVIFVLGLISLVRGHWLPARGWEGVYLFSTAVTTVGVLTAPDPLAAEAAAVSYLLLPVLAIFFFDAGRAVPLVVIAQVVCLATWWPFGALSWQLVTAIVVSVTALSLLLTWLIDTTAGTEHDGLVGLPNRRGLDRRAGELVPAALRGGTALAAALIDLDHFRRFNEAHGHASGDDLLRDVALRWAGELPDSAFLARHGADEFALLLPGHDAEAAGAVLEGLRASMPEGRTVSIGYACLEPGDTFSLLLRRADAALYQAKRNGRDQVWPLPGAATEARRLKQAILTGAISVAYQPVVDLATGRPIAVEALARWHDAERGWIPPGVFVPVAERSGTIVALGRSVVEQACAALAAHEPAGDAGAPPLRLTVNASPVELLEADYVDFVAGCLAATGLDPSRLTIEVTESDVADDGPVLDALHRLRALGVRVAVDDFGTGYSSLHRLEQLPVDILKIDRAFVTPLDGAAEAPVVAAIVALADAMALRVVAEGVETAHQAGVLLEAGCHYGQGWLFGRPGPLSQLEGGPGRVPAQRSDGAPVPVTTS